SGTSHNANRLQPLKSVSRGCWPRSLGLSRSRVQPNCIVWKKTLERLRSNLLQKISGCSTLQPLKSQCKVPVTQRNCKNSWTGKRLGFVTEIKILKQRRPQVPELDIRGTGR